MQHRPPVLRTLLLLALSSCLLNQGTPAFGQEQDKQPDPELERATFKVADGFEVNLFAADPLVAKPIGMNFDHRGRLWIATSVVYPQVKPGEVPDDRVVVLEDTDSDGKADRSRVFAGGLLIPTGVEAGDGGAYVANSTELVHLGDSNGDLKADNRRVMLSGFGTEDTHHIIHTFRWGPDGRLFFNQSIYIHSHVETPWGVQRLNGSGVWRYDPRSAKLEIYARGMINPWGLCWDKYGQTFATDGAGFGGIHYVFPGSAFETATGVKRTLQGLNPGSPKYCANETVSGRHFPDDWQGDIVTNDFRANRVVRYKLTDQDGVYVSKLMPDVLTSTDRAFRPVDVKMGPDGALYIADWYNPIINHGEVDFRDPRRDKAHGRIWRITAKDRKPLAKPKIQDASLDELLDFLKVPEQWTRQQAKMRLRGRHPHEVAAALAKWVKKLDPKKDADVEHHRLEALWTYQTIDFPEPGLLKALLNSKDHRVREAATRVVPDWAGRMPEALELLAARVADEHPRVRLEAVCALARIPEPRAIEIAVKAREKPAHPQLEFALQMAANELKPVWLPAFQQGKLAFGGNREHLDYALRAVESPAALDQIRTQLSFNTAPLESREGMLDTLADLGGPGEAAMLLNLATRERGDYDAAARTRLLARVERMARQRNVLPGGNAKQLEEVIRGDEPREMKLAALRIAGLWKKEEFRDLITAAAVGPHGDAAVTAAGYTALGQLGGDKSLALLKQYAGKNTPAWQRALAIEGLASLDLKGAAAEAADLLSQPAANPDPPNADPGVVLDTFLRRDGGAAALAAALAGAKIPADTAKLGLRHVNTTGRDDPALTARLREAAGLNATPQPPTAQELATIISEVTEKGDAARGELVFRRSDTGCLQCHGVAGAGGQVGPDLRAIGASSPLDYIVEAILVPNKVIKEGYQTVVVATKKGDVFSGIKVKQGDGQMVVRDAQKEHVIPLDQVRREREGGSLMPMGLADALTRQEFVDLVRFLAELGKPGPYGADTAPLVRRWRVLEPAAAKALAADPSKMSSAGAGTLGWTGAYSLVSGVLPPDSLPTAEGTSIAFARCEIDVTAAGRIGLRVNSPAGLKVWAGGRPVEVKPEMEVDLPRGTHTLLFQVDKSQRGNDGLRVELREVQGSSGAAQPVGGA